ncbi:MAG: hypothetical protein ABJH98_14385 [Reichenbachiella sp.]|uniref:hypothetical protein n=1 Tax=Reichenbachiella sp. TaxID=2184521 RepID=UPI00329A0D6D
MFKQKIWEYFTQIIIVIFGVFLGLLLNEWNSGRKDRNRQKVILSHIIKELKSHKNQLNRVIPYHGSMTQTADSILSKSTEEELTKPFIWNGAWSKIPKWQGLQLFPLRTPTYESAKFSEVLSGMDSELLESITGYYESVHTYNSFCNGLTQQVFQINSKTEYVDALLLIMIIKGDILGTEKGINAASDSLIQIIERKL